VVTQPAANTDVQIARFFDGRDFTFGQQRGTVIELGGRGGVVQLWATHHYVGTWQGGNGNAFLFSGLSSNPDDVGEDAALGLDELFANKAIYGSAAWTSNNNAAAGGWSSFSWTKVIPLYGIIRPRRQVWILHEVGQSLTHRVGLEIYYSEIDASKTQEAQVNYKYGKYRRGR